MVVGACRLTLYFGGCRSLKAKRQSLRRLVDRLRAKFNAGVAEVADQDKWQRGVLGICVVGNEAAHLRTMLDKMLRFVEQSYLAQVLDREIEIFHYEGETEPGRWADDEEALAYE